MRKIYFLLLGTFMAAITNAQLTGIRTIPGNYATVAAAVTDLNAQGVGAGGVVFNVAAGHTETAPSGGINVTATGTLANPIVFQKSGGGANPLITSPVGTISLTTTSAAVDGIFSFSGSDYVTIDGIDLLDNNASGADMMEFGYGFFKASATDGCQNNTIKNCVITLNKGNNVDGTTNIFGAGSKGIYFGNVAINAMTTDLVVATAGGRSNGNTIVSNTIQNCFVPIYMRGYGDIVAPYSNLEQNNTIGGNSPALGNVIRNYASASSTLTSFGIQAINQNNILVQYNNINNLAGGGTPAGGLIGGVQITATPLINNSTYDVKNNTISLAQGVNTSQTSGVNIGAAGGTGTVTIDNNTFTGFTNASGITAGAVFATVVSNAAGATLNITNNTYSNNQISAIVNMISLQGTATAATANITGNTFTNNTISNNAAGTTILIANGAAVTGTLNINNNTINGLNFPVAMSNSAALIFSSAAGASLAYTATGNSFQNVTYPAGMTSTLYFMYCATGIPASANFSSNSITNITLGNVTSATIYGIYNTSAMANYTASNNTFSNFTTSSTGTVAFIYNTATISANATVNNNSFTNINRTAASGTQYHIYTGSPANGTYNGNTVDGVSFSAPTSTGTIYGIYDISSGVNMTYTNNIIRNLSVGAAGTLYGIREFGTTGNKTMQNNQIYNFSTSPTGTGGASMFGLSFLAGGTDDISNNQIYSLNSTGTTGGTGGSIIGILVSAGATNNIYKNRIYDLSTNSTGGTVWGMQVTSGTTHNIFNNLIGDLRAPFVSSATDGVRGINLTATTANASINIHYNTIYLNASSAGVNFGATGVFHTTSTTATTANLTLRNNIIYNNSFAKGTGFVTAFRRSSGIANTLNNYNAASNRNLFFAGTPSASQLIYYDGTSSAQTLAAYQAGVFTAGTIAPRDANSVTELSTPFLSTVGSNVNFLHISPSIPTVAEGNGAPIGGVTDDYDGEVRNVATPDIGADEFTGTPVTLCAGTPVAGSITGLNNICAGQFAILNLTGFTSNSGIGLQWQSSAVAGGPYTPIVGATGASYNTGVIPTGTTVYYVVTVTCSNGGASATTAEFAVTSNAAPTVVVTPGSPTICSGGAGVLLTASGALTYSWSPATGLSATTGASVTANPSTTTTYTVTGANVFGCTSITNVTVTVNQSPSITTTTATPSTVCLGNTSQLQVNIPGPSAYCASTHSSGCGSSDEITNVSLNTLSSPSACAASAYTLFPATGATTTTLTAGSPYNLAVSFGADPNQYFGAWIDYNQDGVFAVTEFLGVSANAGANGTISVGFSVPAGAFNGITRLRIVGGNDSPPTSAQACGASSSGFGETEDYDITITGGAIPYTYSWSPSGTLNNSAIANPIATPTATTTYTVIVTAGNGCSTTGNVTVTVGTPIVSSSVVQPTTCVTTDGSIDITVSGGTGGVGPYTYAWTGTGVNPTSQDQTNLGVGSYTVFVTDVPSGCQYVQSFNLTGPGGCNVCQTIPSLTSTPPSPVCFNTPVTLTAAGLTNMGVTYGIRFKYSSTGLPLGDPYTEGVSLNVVPNGGLTTGGTTATYNTPPLSIAGTNYFYAILDPVPLDPACRPFATTAVVVNPQADVTATPSSQTICSGNTITTIVMSGSIPATTYSWTRNNTATVTGIAANGTGNISGSLTNTTFAPITVTFTITPTANGCPGTPITATVTVNPAPLAVPTPVSQTRCSGVPIAPIVIANGTAGQLTIAISGPGFMDEISYQLLDASSNVVQTGGPYAFASTNLSAPVAAINGPYILNIEAQGAFNDNFINWTVNCNGSPIASGCLRGTAAAGVCANVGTISVPGLNCAGTGVAGTTFTWTRNNTVNLTGIAASGSGTPITGTLVNNTTTPQTTVFTITPSANGCAGTPVNVSVLVNPTPTAVATPASQTICTGTAITPIVLSGPVAGTTYAWTRNNTATVTGIAASGSGNISGTLTNTTLAPVTVTFTITPTANACPGTPITATVTVNPLSSIVCPANITVPSVVGGCTAVVNYAPTVTGTPTPTLTYVLSGATTGSGSGSGSGLAFNVGVTTVTITATNVCSVVTCAFTITVTDSQLPVISSQPANRTSCVGSNVVFSVTATNVLTYQWQLFSGGTWNNVPGATSSSLAVNNVTLAMNTNSYRVILNGLCTVVTSNVASLFVNSLPIITINSSLPPALIPGQVTTLTATGIPPGGSYVWLFNGSVMAGVTGNVLAGIGIGNQGSYQVRYTDLNGCTTTSAALVITGMQTELMWVYPNPNFGRFQVRYYNQNPENATVNVYNAGGSKVFQKTVVTTLPYTMIEVDLGPAVAAGTYVVELVNQAGNRVGAKTIIVRPQ